MIARAVTGAFLIAISLTGATAAQTPSDVRAQTTFDHAILLFRSKRPADSAAEFDSLIRMAPQLAPQLWQRGIALYYTGRYADCRKQFDLHRTVNPDDVENAAWHFLCVARSESPERAVAAILPVGPD